MSILATFGRVATLECHGPAPIPQNGGWTKARRIEDLSGFAHGCGTCAPQMGTCKLTLNVRDGIIEEALIEHVGCSGMTHSAAMAAEILPGKTLLEALNTDLVCDATNSAMKALFLNLAYGRTQSSYSDGGLPPGSALEDLGPTRRSQVGTTWSTVQTGPRWLEIAEGYVTRLGLDEDGCVIGCEFVNLGTMMRLIADGRTPNEAHEAARGTMGRYADAVRTIDPRRE